MFLILEAECRKHCSELVQSCNNGGSIIATLRHGYGQCDCDCSEPPGTSILREFKSLLGIGWFDMSHNMAVVLSGD